MNIEQIMLDEIENELKIQIARLDQPGTRIFHEMLTYHMGWTGEGAGKAAAGKRIRPLLVLLIASSSKIEIGNQHNSTIWLHAKPAAAAVELVHNFSLVHDDIQDNSDKRRGRNTVWVNWGVPMAINAGDALFVLANQAINNLLLHYSNDIVVKAAGIINDTCLDLTRGQYLDMSYQGRSDLNLDDYWPMIGGKTSALLSACTHIGALLGGADEGQQESFRLFGFHLGRAFQIQDDILGIWGDESLTGKSTASDLVEGKNSLPVLFALGKQEKFTERWKLGRIKAEDIQAASKELEDEGGRSYAVEMAEIETEKALAYLKEADPKGEAGKSLYTLTNKLLKREQ
jgi:geranylgeranyl diphosphate synthase type I